MSRYTISGRRLDGRKDTCAIGGIIVPSIGISSGNLHTQGVAQAKRIGSGNIDGSRNDLTLASIVVVAANRIGSRTVVAGKDYHTNAVAVLHVIACIRCHAVGGSHEHAVVIPAVLRRIAVFGIIGGLKRVGEATEEGVFHTDAYLALDGFGYGSIYVKYNRINGGRTGRQHQSGVVGINHRRNERAVFPFAEILDKGIGRSHKRVVHIPVYIRRNTEVRPRYKRIHILFFANRRNGEAGGGYHGTYAQYRIAIAIGVQLNAIYALTALGVNMVNAAGGVIVLPQIAVRAGSHELDAVELHQAGVGYRLNRTAYRRSPMSRQNRRAAHRIGGRTIHGGVNHHINAVSRLDVHAGIRGFSVSGIHANAIVEPLVLRIIAVSDIVRGRKGIAGRTEERIGNRNLDIGRDSLFKLNGIFYHKRINDGTHRVVNRVNHGANLASLCQNTQVDSQGVVRFHKHVVHIPVGIGGGSQVGAAYRGAHHVTHANFRYTYRSRGRGSGTIVEYNLSTGIAATIYAQDTAYRQLLVTGGFAFNGLQIAVIYRIVFLLAVACCGVPCPLAGRSIVSLGLPCIFEARVAQTAFIQRMGNRRITYANQRAGRQRILDTRHSNRNGIAIQRAGSGITRGNIGKYDADPGTIHHIHAYFFTCSGNSLTGKHRPLIDTFHIDGVELNRNLNRNGNTVVNALKAFYIMQLHAIRRIGFTNGYRERLRITLAISCILGGIESIYAYRVLDGIGQTVGNSACIDGTLRQHLGQSRIRVPNHYRAAMTVVGNQRISQNTHAYTAVAFYLNIRHLGRFGQGNNDNRI